MFSIEQLPALAKKYAEAHLPNTGYTIRAAQAVYDAYKAGKLPKGTNIAVQFALQFDGAEVGGDLVKNTEKQLPYLASESLDKGADCLDFIRNVYMLFFGKRIGEWTEGTYQNYKDHQVLWEQRRPGDVLLNKLSNRNPHATHAMLCIGNGLMLHTRSPKKPLMVTSDTLYSPKTRTGTGVFRVLTDEEYASLIVGGVAIPDISKPGYVRMLKNTGKPYMTGSDVAEVQAALMAKGFNPGSKDGHYGPKTAAAVIKFQKKYGLEKDGIVGPITWKALGL